MSFNTPVSYIVPVYVPVMVSQSQPSQQSAMFGSAGFSDFNSGFSPAQSMFGGSQPMFGGSQPMFGSAQPMFGGTQPMFDSSQLMFGGAQPMFASAQPTFQGAQSVMQDSSMSLPYMMMGMLQMLLESLMGVFMGHPEPAANPSSQDSLTSPASNMDASTLPALDSWMDYLTGAYPNYDNGATTNNPDYTTDTPTDYEPDYIIDPPPVDYNYDYPPTPPVYPPVKELGSAGLFGDPQFGLFTPTLGTIPNGLKAFESNIKAGQFVTLLSDNDLGGLAITAQGVQVDPNNTNSTGVGSATFTSGSDTVTIHGNGDLIVNGQKKGSIHDAGLMATITLPSGLMISTSQEIDGADGLKAERFLITNGEYKVTAAPRKPHADSQAYLDMNFEELKADAADNATGYSTNVTGFTQAFGIADLLRIEPGDLGTVA